MDKMAAQRQRFNPKDAAQIWRELGAQVNPIASAPVVDLDLQKRLQKRLKDPARIEAERAFWKRQPWYLRAGPLKIFNDFRAIDAGQAAAGTPAWLRVLSIPLALVLYYVLMKLDQTYDINAFLQNLSQQIVGLF